MLGATFLELYYPTEMNENGELNCFGAINKSANGIKQRVSKFLKSKVFMDKEFTGVTAEGVKVEIVGTYSIRKFALTYARRSGCTRGDINVRGRWKRFKQMVDIYIDPDIPYPDAKTTGAFCIGGPVKYILKKGSKLDDCWIAEKVVPHIFKMHKDKNAVVTLGKVLLWACFYAEAQDMVPLQIIKRVVTTYQRVQNQWEPTENSVHKVPLVICGHDGQLIIEELFKGDGDVDNPAHDESNSAATPEQLNRRRSRNSSEMQAVFAQLILIHRQNENLTTKVQILRSHLSKKVKHLS